MFGGVGAHVSLATLAPCSVALKVGTRNWHIVPLVRQRQRPPPTRRDTETTATAKSRIRPPCAAV